VAEARRVGARRGLVATLAFATGALASAACGTDDGGPVFDLGPRDVGFRDAAPRDTGVEPIDDGDGGVIIVDTGVPPCSVQPTMTSIHADFLARPTCAVSGCHGGTSGGVGGLSFGKSKSEVRRDLLDGNTTGGPSWPRFVVAGQPDQSYLYAKVLPASGVARMPPFGDPPDPCIAQVIRIWITNGALDD
jgi:hypothetical protein